MSQQSGSFSLVIHDKNGNPQYLKVQKTQPKKPETVKVIQQKPATSPQVITTQGGNSIVQGSTMLRTVTLQGKQSRQYVTVPIQGQVQGIVKQEHSKVQTVPMKQLMTSPQIIIPNQNNSKQYVLPLETNGTRKRIDESEYSELLNSQLGVGQTIKRRKSEKGGKGLRHFSMKVCEKVKKKGLTSYNEVADELVSEFTDPRHTPNSVDQQYDQKNIRRRVYDALNVLMAMNIISKEKKEIKWLGLPTNSAQENVTLQNEKKEITDRIRAKTQQLNELILQQILYKSIIQRNYEMEKVRGAPITNSAIQLPFVVVNSSKKTVIDCSITNDKSEYLFAFNDKFEIHDDFEVLKKMGLSYGLENGMISKANLNKVKTLVPTPFEKYIDRMLLDADDPANDPGNSSFSWSNNLFMGTDPIDPLDESAGPSSDGYNHLEGSPVDPLNTDDDSNISEEMEKKLKLTP